MPDHSIESEAENITIEFRPLRLFSRQVATTLSWYLVGFVISLTRTDPSMSVNNPDFWTIVAVMTILYLLIAAGRRLVLIRRGGIPPFRFGVDRLELPANNQSRKIVTVLYDDILSCHVAGKSHRAQFILGTTQRTFSFLVSSFVDADADDKIRDALHLHIIKGAKGATQWTEMTARSRLADRLAAVRPVVTWGFSAILILVFIGQTVLSKGAGSELFSLADRGGNASALVFSGEYYRLVTASLLHLNLLHLLFNLSSLLIVGTIVERQLGSKRFAILVMTTGVASQAISAAWAHLGLFSLTLASAGASGAIFGIIGALAVLNRRFAPILPGGYRVTRRSWWILFGLNFVLLPLVFRQIDSAAHCGGLIAGMAVGWLLCRAQNRIDAAPIFDAAIRTILIASSALWIMAPCIAFLHSRDDAAIRNDHALIVSSVAASSHSAPLIDNEMAWSVATQPLATSEQLTEALILAERAVTKEVDSSGISSPAARDDTDTLATLHYRLGHDAQAISLEEPLIYDRPVSGARSQLARFLYSYWRANGLRSLGAATEPPRIALTTEAGRTLAGWGFDLSLPAPLPKGAKLYALLRRGDQPLGLLRIDQPPTDSATWRHVTINGPRAVTDLPAQGTTLVLLQFDGTGCICSGSKSDEWDFFSYEPKIAALP